MPVSPKETVADRLQRALSERNACLPKGDTVADRLQRALSERNACLPKGDTVADRLQTSVYDTLPPVAVTTGYAIYVSGAQTAVSL